MGQVLHDLSLSALSLLSIQTAIVGAVAFCLGAFLLGRKTDRLAKRVQTERTRVRINAAIEKLQHEIAEHNRTEEALRKSEIKYRTLFEESIDGLFITSSQGAILDMNKKGVAILGYNTKEEVQRLDLAQDVYADAADRQHILALVNENGSAEYEVVIKKSDGAKMTAYCSLTAVKDDMGTIVMYRGIIRDVTEQKRIKGALQEAKRRLEYVVSTSPAVIYTCRYGGDWRATFVSENLAEVLGYTARENIETPGFWMDHIHPKDRPRVLDDLNDLPASDYYAHEYRFLHKDGRYLWMLDRFRVVRDERGTPVECIGSWLDITERKQAEEDLRTNRVFLHNILNSIQDPIVVLDQNRAILLANKIFEATFHAGRRQEVLGKACHEILFRSAEPCGTCLAEQSNLTGTVSHKVLMSADGPGGPKWYDVFAYPLFTTEGRVVGNVHHLRDITEHKVNEEKIGRYQEQLRSLANQLLTTEEQSRRKIAQELHDGFPQKLALSKMLLQSVENRIPMDHHATSLFSDVYALYDDMTKEARSLTYQLAPPILYELGLEPAVERLLKEMLSNGAIDWKFENRRTGQPLRDQAAPALYAMIRELVINVLKHARASRVEVTVTQEGSLVSVIVQDDGRGLSGFNAGQAAEMSGFGLFSIRERLLHLGGRLRIESGPGSGTRASIDLPLAPRRMEQQRNDGDYAGRSIAD